ncbi:MAG: hypothetical protein J7501_01635 [Bdellovibrio sp.]|nr:hypothetical protein [Bdellovibrio sp.]
MKKAILASFLLPFLIGTSVAFAEAPYCSSVFTEYKGSPFKESEGHPIPEGAALKVALKEQKEALKVSRFVMDAMTRESDALKAELNGKTLELDVLCVGAGPQCAAASLVLGKVGVRALVLEKTEYVAKTFAEKDFYINSVEGKYVSMHDFPGGVGSLANLTSSLYAHSSQLATHIQSQQYASGVPVLLNTRALSVERIQVSGHTELLITTDQGITIRAKNLLLGTGLGEIGTKVKDVEYQKAFAEYHAESAETPGLKPIMSVDSFLVAVKSARLQKQGVRLPRDIILIGNGDGSRIAIEAFSDKNVTIPVGFKTHWIGNTFKTAAEYTESQGSWDRYLPKIIPQYDAGRITGLAGHVDKVEFLPDSRYRVTAKDSKTGQVGAVEGDMIIDCTGYTNKNNELLANLLISPEMIDVLGPLHELRLSSTVLARQYREAGGSEVPVYAIGSSAGALAADWELVGSPNKNPVAIFNTAARTSAFVSQLLGTKSLASVRGVREHRPAVKSAKTLIAELKKARKHK